MGPVWVQCRCPRCRRLHEFPEGTVEYICGLCKAIVTLTEPEPGPEDGEYGDGEDED